ncbi:MAG: hypothetical protein QG604_651 [Candidatus Dependentiae bacterium]|nr:hypothetical protein [Candidatus Dependentiae bacterium]
MIFKKLWLTSVAALLLMGQSNALYSLPEMLTTKAIKCGAGASTATLAISWLLVRKALKKATSAHEIEPYDTKKEEHYLRLKKAYNALSITATSAGLLTGLLLLVDTPQKTDALPHTALTISQQPPQKSGAPETPPASQSVTLSDFYKCHNIRELKQKMSGMSHDQLNRLLSRSKTNGVNTADTSSSYVKQITLEDGSRWFLKTARSPGGERVFRNTGERTKYGMRQNRSRYDMAQKINALGLKWVTAPKKVLLPLNGAGSDESAWNDLQCAVLAPEMPAGSRLAPPFTYSTDWTKMNQFKAQVKTFLTAHPEAAEELARLIEELPFADAHFGNIAILPNDAGLMIYDTEDVLGYEEENVSAMPAGPDQTKAREKLTTKKRLWGIGNMLGRIAMRPGLNHLALDEGSAVAQLRQKYQARKQQLEKLM